jgi:acyl-coenzyme A thioesterase PaaI-like protein
VARSVLWSRWQEVDAADLTERGVELRRLADSMRRIMQRLVGTAAPLDQIAAAADRLAEVAVVFDALESSGTVYEGFNEVTLAGGDRHASFEHSPFIGRANPLSPPIRLWEAEGRVHGEVVFGSAYEGPPGCVHGGYVAGAFDEVLGATQTLSGNAGMTGTLTVRYRSPTPLHTELRFVGELAGIEGRKIFTRAELHAGDRLCAEAEGIFISVLPGRFQSLKEQRDVAEQARLEGRPAGGPDPG